MYIRNYRRFNGCNSNSVAIFVLCCQLLADADESGGYLQVLESASNIGPIVDMCVVDMDKQGQDVVSV